MITSLQPFSEPWIAQYVETQAKEISDRNAVFEVDGVKYVLHRLENDGELYMMQKTGELGIGPKVFAAFPEKKQAITEYIETPTLKPSIAKRHVCEIGATLRTVHNLPLYGEEGVGYVRENQVRWDYIHQEAAKYDTELSNELLAGTKKAMRVFEEGMKTLDARYSQRIVNIHNDLHPRNLYWTDKGFQIIDWEARAYGHPFWDVSSLAIFLGYEGEMEQEFLTAYLGRAPTAEELKEYALLKKTRWAYTAIVNTMWSYRLLDKTPVDTMTPPNKSFVDYMESFGGETGRPSLEFFVNVSRLSLEEAMN